MDEKEVALKILAREIANDTSIFKEDLGSISAFYGLLVIASL
jgi:hypothetical protein